MSRHDPAVTILADIGGTNTRVAFARGSAVDPGSVRRFSNAGFPDLETVLRAYIAEAPRARIAGACVAAAGPVRDGVATMTNLAWTIRPEAVAEATGAARVAVLNDLQAQGHALGRLAPGTLRTILHSPARPGPGAAQLVIGVGTGFNAAPVHDGHAERIVAASECGHASLPVQTDPEIRLQRFVEKAHGFAGVEDVLSGRGLERVHAWAADEAGAPGERSAAGIMAAMADGSDALAETVGRTFVGLLGRVAGDLALIHLPFGGIYLIGGVARAFTAHFERLGFGGAFRAKGRFSDFMDNFAVHIVEDDYAALTGCAAHLDAVLSRGG
ncbi:MAG: glucokinase [Pseudomonadota bacterium]|jgi:glucokinase